MARSNREFIPSRIPYLSISHRLPKSLRGVKKTHTVKTSISNAFRIWPNDIPVESRYYSLSASSLEIHRQQNDMLDTYHRRPYRHRFCKKPSYSFPTMGFCDVDSFDEEDISSCSLYYQTSAYSITVATDNNLST